MTPWPGRDHILTDVALLGLTDGGRRFFRFDSRSQLVFIYFIFLLTIRNDRPISLLGEKSRP
jgi:hypothetical protein